MNYLNKNEYLINKNLHLALQDANSSRSTDRKYLDKNERGIYLIKPRYI